MGKNPFVSTASSEAQHQTLSPHFGSDSNGFDPYSLRNWNINQFLYYSQRFLEQNGWYLVLGIIVLYNIYWYLDGVMKSMYQKRSLQIATSVERKAKYEDDIKRARQRQAEELDKMAKEKKLNKQKLTIKESIQKDDDTLLSSNNNNMNRNQNQTTPTNRKITKEKKKKSPELTFRSNRNEYNPLLGHGGASGYRPKGFARPSGGG